MEKIKILGFGASLRKGGYSTMILESAKELLPTNATLEIFSLEGIPAFNQDLEGPDTFPERVREFKKRIKEADALLVITPEYNHSVPGYLKNAIDWATRPSDNPFAGKPGAIISSSDGRFGGVRAYAHMLQILMDLDIMLLPKPEVCIANAPEKIKEGRVADERTMDQMRRMLQGLTDLAAKL